MRKNQPTIHQFTRMLFITTIPLLLSGGCYNKTSPPGSDLAQSEQEHRQKGSGYAVSESFKITDEISTNIKLGPLSKNQEGNEFELRLWTNVGTFFEKLLVIRSSKERNSASFFEIDRSRDAMRFQKRNISAPRSGWTKLLMTMKEKGIEIPLRLRREEPVTASRDGGLLIIEIFDDGEYDSIYFGEYTSSVDGKRVFDWCNYLASEFNTDMDCRGEHTTP